MEQRSLRRCTWFKVLLWFVYLAGCLVAGGGEFSTLYLYEKYYYDYNVEKLSHDLMSDICADDMYELSNRFNGLKAEGYFNENISEKLRSQLYEGFMDNYSKEDTNFFFTISDMNDKPLLSSYSESKYQCSRVQIFQDTVTEHFSDTFTEEEYAAWVAPDNAYNINVNIIEKLIPDENLDDAYGQPIPESTSVTMSSGNVTEKQDLPENFVNFYEVSYDYSTQEDAYYITGYVRSDLIVNDRYANIDKTVTWRYRNRYVFPVCGIVGAIFALVSIVMLLWSAGYSKITELPVGTFAEKIPLDVFTLLIGCMAALSLIGLKDLILGSTYIEMAIILGICELWAALGLWWLISVAIRIRTKTILSHNLTVILGKFLHKSFVQVKAHIHAFWEAMPFIWQGVVAVVLYFVGNIFGFSLLSGAYYKLGSLILILLITAFMIVMCVLIWNLHILDKGGNLLANGDFSQKIPEKNLLGKFRQHAQNLNSLGDSMNKAVSDRLKSEMFRTELISNVSHDIRTPLTSIINYTDLLSDLHLDNPQALEYIDVLKRQSARLRKLTEDVLEASKATTGSIKVNKEIMDLRVLMEQMEGEYCERFEEKHLTLIKDIPDAPLYISVDGRLLWRVMDNLFGNICKYAMEGTRVYLNILPIDGEVICMLRNISGAQLNISAEELMERFVQGDRSRNTEGSGLGLSIAQSLTSLQGGTMELKIDGDLFKVTIVFPSASQKPKQETGSAN